jgi:hypothetical protein
MLKTTRLSGEHDCFTSELLHLVNGYGDLDHLKTIKKWAIRYNVKVETQACESYSWLCTLFHIVDVQDIHK